MGSCKWPNSSVRGELCIGRGKNERRRKRGRLEGGDTWKCRNTNGYPSEGGQKTVFEFSKGNSYSTGAPVEEGHFSLHRNKKVLISDIGRSLIAVYND